MDQARAHENDVYLSGYSDQILRFVAERGGGGQLLHVEQIDQAYNVKSIKIANTLLHSPSALPPAVDSVSTSVTAPVPKWRTVRVFISSTFKDMHGERDLLTRFVFPELRARAKQRYISVYEMDFRWGVTEKEMHSDKGIEICLSEVSKCDLFIGLLGTRYGWTPSKYVVPNTPDFDWVKTYPSGRSITELEIQQTIGQGKERADERAFFYFRDSDFLENVPESVKPSFTADKPEHQRRLHELKQQIRTSGCEVFDGYSCHWGGVVDGKPMVTGLEEFGSRVLNNVWNAICRKFPDEDAFADQLIEEEALHDAFAEHRRKEFVGRKNLLKQAQLMIERMEEGVIAFVGKQGCGRTSLMSAFLYQYADSRACSFRHLIISHFVGITPGSSNILSALKRIMSELKVRFHLTLTVPDEFHELVSVFSQFLTSSVEICGSSSRLVVFMDALDALDPSHQAHTLEWLPDPLPKGVVFVVSVIDGGQLAASLERRTQKPNYVTVGGLDMFDKAEVVRQSLKQHRKSLDESPFNNQLKLLLSKKDATVPLYLSIACEELRVFGVFEKVSEKLKKMPTSLSGLLQDVIQRLESDHGQELLSTALQLLCCTRIGLSESELIGLLRLHQTFSSQMMKLSPLDSSLKDILDGRVADCVPPVRFSHLVRSLRGFLQPTAELSEGLLVLAYTAVIDAVKLRYRKGSSLHQDNILHRLLAAYFYWEIDPKGDKSFDGANKRALSELPHHLASAGLFSELEVVLCDLHFIETKCLVGLGGQLPDDFVVERREGMTTAQEREHQRFLDNQSVNDYRLFILKNLHIISRYPSLVLQQALNEPSCSVVSQAAQQFVTSQSQASQLLSWSNKREGMDPCKTTLTGFSQAVNVVTISPNRKHLACGSFDCTLKLYDLTTGKELRSFVGHSDAISGCCFAGVSRLCSASVDGKLSLWDVEEGHRVSMMHRHKRRVGSCASDPAGKLIVSVGWDCAVYVWNAKDGKQVCELKGEKRPINCVDFHPEGDFVVTGSWDASLKIWDVFNKKKIKTLRGHQAAVRAVAYSPTGLQIASASLDGEVKLWSSLAGSQVGTIAGHSQPINRLCFTHLGHHLVTVSDDQLIKVWSGQLGKPVNSIASGKALGSIHCLSISPDGHFVAIGYHGKTVRICRLEEETEICVMSDVHGAAVCCITWSGDGQSLVSGSDDCTLKVFDTQDVHNTRQPCSLIGHQKGVWCVACSDQRIASGSEDFTVNIYFTAGLKKSTQTAGVVPKKVLTHHTAPVTGLCFTSDGKQLISASRDRSLVVWSVTGEPIKVLHECHKDWISSCAIADNDSYLVTASNDFTLKLWSMKTYSEKAVFTGHVGAINSVAIKAGCVVSASVDGTVKVWSHRGVEITTLHGNGQRVNACAVHVAKSDNAGGESSSSWAEMVQDATDFEEKGTTFNVADVVVTSGRDDGTVSVWKALQAHELNSLVGHSDRVVGVTTNGTDIITSSFDKTVKIWSPKLDDATVLSFSHGGAVTSVVMSQCGNWALSSSRDGMVAVWKLWVDDEDQVFKNQLFCSFKTHDDSTNAVCFISTSKTQIKFVTAGNDGFVTFWVCNITASPARVPTATEKHQHSTRPVTCLAYNSKSGYLVSGGWNGIVSFWNVTKKKVRRARQLKSQNEWILTLAFVGDSHLVVGTAGNEISVWDLTEFKCACNVYAHADSDDKENKNKCWPAALCITQQACLTQLIPQAGNLVAIAGDTMGLLTVRDVSSLKELWSKKVHSSPVTSIAVGIGSIYTSSGDGTIKVWSCTDGKQVGQFFCRAPVTTMALVCVRGYDTLIAGDSIGNVEFLATV